MLSRILALIALLFAMVLATTPTVFAHAADADGGGSCVGDIKIVLFDGHDMTGEDDDFCFSSSYFNAVNWVADPHFSVNNAWTATIPQDDVGNRMLMAGFVSSISIRNDSAEYLCVRYYSDPNYGGWSESTGVGPFSHTHQDFLAWHDNLYDSLKVFPYNC